MGLVFVDRPEPDTFILYPIRVQIEACFYHRRLRLSRMRDASHSFVRSPSTSFQKGSRHRRPAVGYLPFESKDNKKGTKLSSESLIPHLPKYQVYFLHAGDFSLGIGIMFVEQFDPFLCRRLHHFIRNIRNNDVVDNFWDVAIPL